MAVVLHSRHYLSNYDADFTDRWYGLATLPSNSNFFYFIGNNTVTSTLWVMTVDFDGLGAPTVTRKINTGLAFNTAAEDIYSGIIVQNPDNSHWHYVVGKGSSVTTPSQLGHDMMDYDITADSITTYSNTTSTNHALSWSRPCFESIGGYGYVTYGSYWGHMMKKKLGVAGGTYYDSTAFTIARCDATFTFSNGSWVFWASTPYNAWYKVSGGGAGAPTQTLRSSNGAEFPRPTDLDAAHTSFYNGTWVPSVTDVRGNTRYWMMRGSGGTNRVYILTHNGTTWASTYLATMTPSSSFFWDALSIAPSGIHRAYLSMSGVGYKVYWIDMDNPGTLNENNMFLVDDTEDTGSTVRFIESNSLTGDVFVAHTSTTYTGCLSRFRDSELLTQLAWGVILG